MSTGRDEQEMPDLEAVGNAYREAGFDDEPPAHVDAFIRAAAKRASKRNFNAYLPSLAMAATIVLALGLVLRLTVPGRDLRGPSVEFEADELAAPQVQAPEAFQDPEPLEQQTAPLADSDAPGAESFPVVEDTNAQSDQGSSVELEESVTPARASAAASEENAATTLAPAATVVLQREEGLASSVNGRMAAPSPASVPCSAPERAAPDLWLTCITTQIDAGLLDAARAELEQFRLAFSDYAVPANIVEALEP